MKHCLLLFLICTAHAQQVARGSLVVFSASAHGDYVVVGADSRTVDLNENYLNDSACKLIALGRDTIFFDTGISQFRLPRSKKTWSGFASAGRIYSTLKIRSGSDLTEAWAKEASMMFSSFSPSMLKTMAYGPHGTLSSAGFIAFSDQGVLSTFVTEIYLNDMHKVQYDPMAQAHQGQLGYSGVGIESAQEFFARKTFRATTAYGPNLKRHQDAMTDAGLIKKAIEFVESNGSERDKRYIGGPTDIAIIRNNHTIEWMNRKPACGIEDYSKLEDKTHQHPSKRLK